MQLSVANVTSVCHSHAPIFLAVLDLEGAVQTYAWGKQGLQSKVAQLARAYKGVTIDDSEYYAEVCSSYTWAGCAAFIHLCA